MPIALSAAFDSHEEAYAARCHPETRVALLESIKTWEEASTSKSIFWLNGMAGTGKSTISRSVCKIFAERKELGASFLFKRDQHERNNAKRFFTTIAAQLVARYPSLLPKLSAALIADPMVTGKALGEQFQKLILDPIADLAGKSKASKTLLLVIDALDECDNEDDMKAIVYLLVQAKKVDNVRLKIFITSRPNLPILLGFGKIEGEYEDFILQNVPSGTISQDIATFLDSELGRIKTEYNSLVGDDRRLGLDWPGSDIVQKLLQKAVPLFILAATICRFLGDMTWCDPDGQLAKILQHWGSQGSQIDQLDATYRPVLDQVLKGKKEGEQVQILAEFRQVVGPIVLIEDPLPADSLALLLDVPRQVIHRRLMSLHSVLNVPLKNDAPVKMLHLSFRDFLVNVNGKGKNPFWIDETRTHELLASQCIRLLQSNNNLRQDICDLRHPGASRTGIEPDALRNSLPPQLRYACLYWVHHLERSKAYISDAHPCYLFLKSHLLHWLEALSLLGKAVESISMINTLQTLIDPTNSSNGIAAFLKDAYRFVLHCHLLIDDAPLQVYCAALIFAPHASLVRFKFENKIPNWVRSTPVVDTGWDACLLALEGHKRKVTALALSEDGKLLASSSYDNTVRLWDIFTGAHRQTMLTSGMPVRLMAFSPNGKILVTIWSLREIVLWDIVTGSSQKSLKCPFEGRIVRAGFSPNSKMLMLSSADGVTRTLDIHLSEHTNYVHQKVKRLEDLVLDSGQTTLHSPKFKLLIFGSSSGIIRVLSTELLPPAAVNQIGLEMDPKTGLSRKIFYNHNGPVNKLAFSPDGRSLASGSDDPLMIRLWSTGDSWTSRLLVNEPFKSSPSMSFSSSSSTLATQGLGLTRFWACGTGAQIYLSISSHNTYLVSFAQNRDIVAVAQDNFPSERPTITLLNEAPQDLPMQAYKMLAFDREKSPYATNEVTNISFSPDVSIIAFTTQSSLHAWDLIPDQSSSRNAVKCLWQTRHGFRGDEVKDMSFSPDSRIIALAVSGRGIYLVDATSGEWLPRLKEHSKDMVAVSFSPDGNTLASCESAGVIRLWNLESRACFATLATKTIVNELEFIDNGTGLRTERGTLRIRTDAQDPNHETHLELDTFATEDWLIYQNRRLLRFPPAYRPISAAVHGDDKLAMGHESGHVTVIRFDFRHGVSV